MENTVSVPVLDVAAVFTAIETWIKQRPGLDPANYGLHPEQLRYSGPRERQDAFRAYRAEIREIGKDRTRAMKALDEARNLLPARPELLAESFYRAFSGRLTWDGTKLNYTTGQYWPTEYRKAAASVLEQYTAAWRQAYADEHPQTFTYRTIEDVIAANQSIGNHWFDRSTMRFFHTRVESGAVAIHDENGQPTRARFITSEKGPDGVRRYSIREAQPDGTIDTIGEFGQYASRDAARKDLLKERS